MTESLNYQPTAADLENLHERGITLEEVLSCDWPTPEELDVFTQFGGTLIDAILLTSVKANILDALGQMVPIRYQLVEIPLTTEMLSERQTNFIYLLLRYTSGNPYFPSGFTRADAEHILQIVQNTPWTPENFNEQYDLIASLVQ
jgi:hypothetical protein